MQLADLAGVLLADGAAPVDQHRKRDLLAQMIKSGRIEQALVFTRMKHAAGRLAEQLERDGIRATAIHGEPVAVRPDGRDVVAAGSGNDTIRARDGMGDQITCGPGSDAAFDVPAPRKASRLSSARSQGWRI